MKIRPVGAEGVPCGQTDMRKFWKSLFEILWTRMKWWSITISASDWSHYIFIRGNKVFPHPTASIGIKKVFGFSNCCATNCYEIAGRTARLCIQFCKDKLLYERPITIYEQLPPDKLFTYILGRSCYSFTNFKTVPQLQQTYVPIVLQIKPRLQALYQHNRSTFPFAYHDIPTALAANSSMQQILSWEANFCSVTFMNLTVVNIRNLSSLGCKAVQFGTQVTTVTVTCYFHFQSITAFHLTVQYPLLIHKHMKLLFPASRLQSGGPAVRFPVRTRDFSSPKR